MLKMQGCEDEVQTRPLRTHPILGGTTMEKKDRHKTFPKMKLYTSRVEAFKKSMKTIDQKVLTGIEAEIGKENQNLASKEIENYMSKDNENRSTVPEEKPSIYDSTKNMITLSDDEDGIENVESFPSVISKRHTRQARKQLSPNLDKLLKNIERVKNEYLRTRSMEKTENLSFTDIDDDVMAIEEDVNRLISVRIRWRGSINRLHMRKNQPFCTILPDLAKMFSVPEQYLLLSVKDVIISPDDTPNSISFSICDTIDCGRMNAESSNDSEKVLSQIHDPDALILKLQTQNRKNTVELPIKKNAPLLALMKKYSDHAGVSINQLVFKFDGDVLDPESSAEDLDLEDGFCIDVIINS